MSPDGHLCSVRTRPRFSDLAILGYTTQMANDRFNIRLDGSMISRLLIDLLSGGALSIQGIDADDDPMTARPVAVGGKYISAPTGDPLDANDAGYLLLDIYRRLVIAGGDADDAAATVNPVLGGGKYISAPTGDPLDANDAGYLLLDIYRRLVIAGGDADDAAATAKPVLVGGKYILDPTVDTLDDGDAGYALLNLLRMQIVEDRVYDAPTDANKNVPVWSQADRWATAALGDSLGADGTVTKYVSMSGYLRWSIQYAITHAAAEVATLTVAQSNDEVDDPTTATYQDVTNTFFGVAGYTTASWIEPENPTACVWLRVQVTVTAWTAGTVSWTIKTKKLAQA